MELKDFGWAIQQLKAGNRVCREGWNGKGMWLVLIRPGGIERFPAHYGLCGNSMLVQPCIGMKTAQNTMLPGWLASQTDMLAEDWMIVD